MSNKILPVIFVILFIVLLGEVGYLFYSSRQPAPNSQLIPADISTLPERQGTQAIKDNVLNHLSVTNSGVIKSSTLTNHYEGKIIELINTIDDPTSDYGIKIRIKGENGAINGFFYNKDEAIKKLLVFRSVKDVPIEKITLEDLKIGDSISIDENLNLLDDDLNNFIIGFKITVLQ